MRLLRLSLLGLLGLCLAATLACALDFPALTGRVVDQAGILSAENKSDIAAKSQALEEKSGIQLVVATVPSLQGSDIETYANELFRAWKLGEAQKNNGVLLLVAPTERKVRIEVGYGLEGTLTDALASAVIANAIVPRFKDGDFPGGVEGGVNGIVSVLSGDTADWQPMIAEGQHISIAQWVIIVVIFSVLFGAMFSAIWDLIRPKRQGHYVKRGDRMVYVPARSSWRDSSSGSSSDSSSSSSSDDFSGGGGSSGGGGASGSW
jgi:uncharacterized protein